MITLGEAARLTGLGKTTVARAIKAGRLSATRTATGSYEIDPAELARCYPFKAASEATDATVEATGPVLWVHRTNAKAEAAGATAALEAHVAGLRAINDLLGRQLDEVREVLGRQLDEVREDRERWRTQAEAVQRLITGPQERSRRSQVEAGRERRPWWRQLAVREGLKVTMLLGAIVLMFAIIADKLK
jgi:excisionase family DNA binding protein